MNPSLYPSVLDQYSEPSSCDNLWKDQSDTPTKRALYVLAGLNIFVIIQGLYTFRLRLKNDSYQMRLAILTQYSAALSCLIVAEVYFVSGAFSFPECTQNFL